MVVNSSILRMRSAFRCPLNLSWSSNLTMATGDLKNNLMKLLRETRRMKIELEPDIQGYDQ